MIFGYHLDYWSKYGKKVPIILALSTYCHLIITGASGTGKTVALQFLIGQLLKYEDNINIYIIDFKNSKDFAYLKEYPRYFSGKFCYDGVKEYYREFTEARENGVCDKRYILIFEEYGACISYYQGFDKVNKTKYTNEILNMIAEMLMLGRNIGNFGFCIWLSLQRADSTFFQSGVRDNAHVVIGLGNLKKEAKAMLFPQEDIPKIVFQKGEGILFAESKPLYNVKFPYISNMESWQSNILRLLMVGCLEDVADIGE